MPRGVSARRCLLVPALLVPMLAGAVPVPHPTAAAQPALAGRPNVLIIVTDDQRADALDHMRSTKGLLAKGGTTFTNAFATTPLCCPSRASILTGRYAHNHHVEDAGKSHRKEALAAERYMVQKQLRLHGYATALYGKFLNNWRLRREPKHLNDWAIISNAAPDGYRSGLWNIHGKVEEVDQYSTTFLREQALDFLDDQETTDDQPWFLYVAPVAPHAPFEPERRYADARVKRWKANPGVGEDRSDKPAWVQQATSTRKHAVNIRRKQLRTLMSVDDLVGALVRRVDALGEGRDTLIIYTSDNGYLWAEHGLDKKRYPYLQSVRVPFFMRWPGTVEAGAIDDRLVGNLDIAATIAELAGVELRQQDGRSLFTSQRDRLLLEYFEPENIKDVPTWAAIVTHDYQYIEYTDNMGMVIEREYYDLATDPWQLTNLLGDDDATNDPLPTTLAQMTVQLHRDRTCYGTDQCP